MATLISYSGKIRLRPVQQYSRPLHASLMYRFLPYLRPQRPCQAVRTRALSNLLFRHTMCRTCSKSMQAVTHGRTRTHASAIAPRLVDAIVSLHIAHTAPPTLPRAQEMCCCFGCNHCHETTRLTRQGTPKGRQKRPDRHCRPAVRSLLHQQPISTANCRGSSSPLCRRSAAGSTASRSRGQPPHSSTSAPPRYRSGFPGMPSGAAYCCRGRAD